MITMIGLIVLLVGLICWIGQTIVLFNPSLGLKLGLNEAESEMDETFYILETKPIALIDLLLTWILPVSAILMILDHPSWPILALIGAGIYLYFPSNIISHRIYLKKYGKKIGNSTSVLSAYIFSGIWILSAIVMIVLAINEIYTI